MLVETPKFWTWAHIELNEENIHDVSKSNRFQNLGNFSLLGLGSEGLNTFYSELLNLSSPLYGFLDVSEQDMSSVSPEILGQLVTRMNWVFMRNIKMSGEQVDQMFSSIDRSERLALEELYSIGNDISSVSPESLSRQGSFPISPRVQQSISTFCSTTPRSRNWNLTLRLGQQSD